jgi:RNA polymerase sigma factor (sigma-70 family)
MQVDLRERARGGDHEAFSTLVAASLGRLYAVACLILRDRDRAEDATQEALVQAWRDIRGLRDPERFDAWLHRLLVRACYRHARREQRRAVVELRVVPQGDQVDLGHDLLISQRDALNRAFARLDLDQRAVVVLHHYAGLPLTEVGRILGIPAGTAKSRLHRGVGAMRAALEADDRDQLLLSGRTA